jgi:N-acyl-D-amino-acid deacylase
MLLSLLLFAAQVQSADAYDIVITNARLIDGTGRPARAAEIGIRGGWIAKITAAGGLRAAATRDRVDARGLVVAPGFIDVHSHTDDAIADSGRRYNEGAVRQGVTTVVGGPDGGAAPSDIKTLIAALGRQGAGTNLAMYVGHNAVRAEIMKDAQRAPTADELTGMKRLVREGMELGAVGLSTGLMYEPGMWSTTDEVIELAKEVAPFRGIYDSHVRDPVKRFLWSDEEVLKVGEAAGIAPTFGHE